MHKAFFTIGKNKHKAQINFTREGEFHMWDNSQPMPKEDQPYCLFPWRTHILSGHVCHITENKYEVTIGSDEWGHVFYMTLNDDIYYFEIEYLYNKYRSDNKYHFIAINYAGYTLAMIDTDNRLIMFKNGWYHI